MKVLISLALSIIVSSALSQEFLPGYILTLEGDTIRGEVYYGSQSKYNECRFKINEKEETFSADEIAGYGVDGVRAYTSGVIPSSFVEEVGVGIISLYKNENYYVFVKKGESNVLLDRNEFDDIKMKGRYLGSLKYITSDCELNYNFEKMSLKESSFVRVLSKYNECRGVGFSSAKDNLPGIKIEVGPSIGLNFYTLKNSSNRYYNARQWQGSFPQSFNATSLAYGLDVVLMFPKTSNRFSLRSGFIVSQLEFGERLEQDYLNDPVINTTDFKFNTFSIPLIFQYDLIKTSLLDLRLLGGFQWAFMTKERSYILKEVFFSYSDPITLELVDEYDFGNNLLMMFGVEVKKSIKNYNVGMTLSYALTPNPEAGGFPEGGSYEGLYTRITMFNTSLFARYIF